MSEARSESGAQPPVLSVITPNTTPEEIAALVAVLAALGREQAPTPKTPNAWSAHRRKLTPSYPHGLGGWRTSGLPR